MYHYSRQQHYRCINLLIQLFLALVLMCALSIRGNAQTLPGYNAVRTVDPQDTDFRDLDVISKAIGTHRIVVLAEQDHGDGTTHLAKTRLVKLLHQKMGFTVLAFEADYYTLYNLQQNRASVESIRKEIFPFWSSTAETDPLWHYLDSVSKTAKPLHVAGFDIQLNSAFARMGIADELRKTLLSSNVDGVDKKQLVQFFVALDTLLNSQRPSLYHEQGKKDFTATLERLKLRFASDKRMSILLQALWYKSEHGFYRTYREKNMAANLAQLLANEYKDQKVVVWTASLHAIKNMQALVQNNEEAAQRYAAAQDKDTVEYMVQLLIKKHSISAYTINFVATSGSYTPTSWVSIHNTARAVAISPQSVESWAEGQPGDAGFIDLRNLPTDHRLQSAAPMIAYLHQRTFTACWPNVFDGLFFIKNMRPLTPLSK